jgi:hypothetical protein
LITGKHKWVLVFLVSLLLVQFYEVTNSNVSANSNSEDWPMLRHDPSHSGASSGSPALTPTPLWNYTPNTSNDILAPYNFFATGWSSPAVVDSVVYIGWSGYRTEPAGHYILQIGWGGVFAFNTHSGAQLWNLTIGSGCSSPAVVGGVLYFGSGDSLYALNAINGAKLWNYTGGGASPVVVDGVVYFGLGSRVYALGKPYSTTPPKISVLSPLSQQYNESSVSLVFTVDKPVNWTGYSLDGKENITVTGNTTLTGLSNGSHNVTVYAKDLVDAEASDTVWFNVAELFPVVPVAAVSVAVVAVVGAGLLIYFKKRKH